MGPVLIIEAEDKSSEGKKTSILNDDVTGDCVLLENSNQGLALRLLISASPCLDPAVLFSHQEQGPGSAG